MINTDQNNLEEISKNIKNFGVTKKNDWMSHEDIQKVQNIIKEINCKKGSYDGIFDFDYKFKAIEFIKLRFKKIAYEKYLVNLSKKLELKKIADEAFSFPSKLYKIDCYVSPVSNEPIIDWHLDNAYSGKLNITKFVNPEEAVIKFFFYLSDVSTDNGCLSYIPKSHYIAFALRKGIYEKAIKYTPYWKLEQFRKTILIKENLNYIKSTVDSNILEEFLLSSDFSSKTNIDQAKYDHPVKCGGAVIFDEGGVHRGSRILKNSRLALRYFFQRDKKF